MLLVVYRGSFSYIEVCTATSLSIMDSGAITSIETAVTWIWGTCPRVLEIPVQCLRNTELWLDQAGSMVVFIIVGDVD